MQTVVIRLLVFFALAGSANAAQTTYNFNFSAGGTGSFVYDDVAMTATAITFDFGALGAIAPYGFDSQLTAAIFGTPPTAAVHQDNIFFGVTQVAGNRTATVRLYTNGTYCLRPYPEPSPDYCLVSGTYLIAPAVLPPPPSVSGTYAFNFSTGGSGYFTYDASSGAISILSYDFGIFGSGSTDFDAFLTNLVFGTPLASAVVQDNTFFGLTGGSAYGLRLRTDGTFCVRPDVGACGDGTPDTLSGTYHIALAEPGVLVSGTNVVAVPNAIDEADNPVQTNVVLTFDHVQDAGNVSLVVKSEASVQPPSGFTLAGTNTAFDLSTTGAFAGGVEVCVPYDDTISNENALRLLHLHDGVWFDITVPDSPDTVNNRICGRTDSFSLFAVASDVAPPAASPTQSPTANNAGWNNTNVTVNWNWADNAPSAIDVSNCTTSSTSSGEGIALAIAATCQDHAGNVAQASYVVAVDKTKPTLSPSVSPSSIFLNGTATATSGAADALSGLSVVDGCDALDTTTPGTKTVTCTATDNAGNSNSASATYVVNYAPVLKSVGEARAWIGLKNSDDQGTRFDVMAELYKGSSLIASGLTRCIAGVTRNANSALAIGVPFEPLAQSESVPLAPGDALTMRLSTRIGTNANGTKCTGPNNATGLRLYYDGTTRPSGVGVEILPAELATYFLHTVGTTHMLNRQSPAGAAKFKDSPAVNFLGGNVWKTIGEWTLVIP